MQSATFTPTATQISGQLDKLDYLVQTAQFTVITQDGSAISQAAVNMTVNFTGVSLVNAGSIAGNIISLDVHGMSMKDNITLFQGTVLISNTVISQSWNNVVMQTTSFTSDRTFNGLQLVVNGVSFDCASCSLTLTTAATPMITSALLSGKTLTITGSSFGNVGDSARIMFGEFDL